MEKTGRRKKNKQKRQMHILMEGTFLSPSRKML
jgi:hypothetical protein